MELTKRSARIKSLKLREGKRDLQTSPRAAQALRSPPPPERHSACAGTRYGLMAPVRHGRKPERPPARSCRVLIALNYWKCGTGLIKAGSLSMTQPAHRVSPVGISTRVQGTHKHVIRGEDF